MTTDTATTPALETPTPPAVASLARLDEMSAVTSGNGLSAAQLRTALVDDGLGRGLMTRSEVDAALKNAGLEPLAEPSAPDANAAEPVEADPLGALQAGKPESFRLPPLDGTPGEVVHAAKTFQAWLSTAELPTPIGNHIAGEINRFVRNNPDYESWNDAKRQIHATTELGKVNRFFGKDAQRNIDMARQLVAEVESKQPGVFGWLERSGAGNLSNVIIQLATHGQRLSARRSTAT